MALSEEVRNFIRDLDYDDSGLTPEEYSELQEIRPQVLSDVANLIRSREVLGTGEPEGYDGFVENYPGTAQNLFDEHFTRVLVEGVPGYAARMLELSAMRCTRFPSQVTNVYLQEAVRAYVFGFPQASVALCRAALEQALKEGIGYQGTGTFVQMKDLLDEAESAGVIDKINRLCARRVADAADSVLHEKPIELSAAFEVLIQLRGVLQFIYSTD
jgi:hypothetical protein